LLLRPVEARFESFDIVPAAPLAALRRSVVSSRDVNTRSQRHAAPHSRSRRRTNLSRDRYARRRRDRRGGIHPARARGRLSRDGRGLRARPGRDRPACVEALRPEFSEPRRNRHGLRSCRLRKRPRRFCRCGRFLRDRPLPCARRRLRRARIRRQPRSRRLAHRRFSRPAARVSRRLHQSPRRPPARRRRFQEGSKVVADNFADVCLVGVGAVGGILAKELASAGLKVVGFERGPAPRHADYAPRDSIRFIARTDRLDWVRHEPTTTRSRASATAEIRYRTSPLNVLGGALLHWTGQVSRYMPGDFKVYTNEIVNGGAERAGADLTGYDVVDWPIGYDDLEPYYEKFEWEFGVSGRAGVNPFAGPRKRGYPLPPLRRSARMELFAEACGKLGYHAYDSPAGILSEAYKPPAPYDARIPERPACV